MYCTKCGNELAEWQRFCNNCGEKIVNNSEVALEDALVLETVEYNSVQMKWYNFLVYFYLIAMAVLYFLSMLIMFVRPLFYNYTVGHFIPFSYILKSNILASITLLAYAILYIITRKKLASYKKDGPKFLYIIYSVDILSQIGFLILTAADKTGLGIGTPILGIIMLALVLWANIIYFRKRADMFVN